MSDANSPSGHLQEAEEQYAEAGTTRYEMLAYLSRYLFWLVMAILLAVFSVVI